MWFKEAFASRKAQAACRGCKRASLLSGHGWRFEPSPNPYHQHRQCINNCRREENGRKLKLPEGSIPDPEPFEQAVIRAGAPISFGHIETGKLVHGQLGAGCIFLRAFGVRNGLPVPLQIQRHEDCAENRPTCGLHSPCISGSLRPRCRRAFRLASGALLIFWPCD